MSFKSKLIGLVVLAVAGTIAVNVMLNRMEAAALAQASAIADGAAFCWVDGHDTAGDRPGVRFETSGVFPFEPWDDFKDSVLNREQAKPFHFGFVVPGAEDTPGAFWAWSYWDRAYWEDVDLATLRLLGGTQIVSDCRGR